MPRLLSCRCSQNAMGLEMSTAAMTGAAGETVGVGEKARCVLKLDLCKFGAGDGPARAANGLVGDALHGDAGDAVRCHCVPQ